MKMPALCSKCRVKAFSFLQPLCHTSHDVSVYYLIHNKSLRVFMGASAAGHRHQMPLPPSPCTLWNPHPAPCSREGKQWSLVGRPHPDHRTETEAEPHTTQGSPPCSPISHTSKVQSLRISRCELHPSALGALAHVKPALVWSLMRR